ncbi:30S ribosomal protein S30 [Denitrobacterium detoxificans]|uniref:Ribosome hibernation promoting factor n=1 Tax=Denitrobacterium detoxificans TaxID=79604 RepID=A0A172RZG3_9ACTN|nr:ribosome-associated translation inhibitor RaiA [Denitrobacterium detoxificans]ANE23106.1 30S ribosomal protein S30 [Denitrobacterium detoxificans]SEO53337.1 SSU ribosomal protein S30P /sigma 54 modulation protein [Denitrobacterium detoxificans]
MEITVTGRKMPITDALKSYAEEKIGNSMKVMDIDPLIAEVVLHMEQNPAIACPAVCEVTMTAKGHIIRVEEREEDMYAAIDVAAAKVLRQLRKFKTRVVEHKTRTKAESIRTTAEETDFDALMEELADDAVVREKDVEFLPLTEEEALVQIDLLGHDFFGYIDRDTDTFRILYRRDNGGYGLLKQI